jgi:hypothetical protein
MSCALFGDLPVSGSSLFRIRLDVRRRIARADGKASEEDRAEPAGPGTRAGEAGPPDRTRVESPGTWCDFKTRRTFTGSSRWGVAPTLPSSTANKDATSPTSA